MIFVDSKPLRAERGSLENFKTVWIASLRSQRQDGR